MMKRLSTLLHKWQKIKIKPSPSTEMNMGSLPLPPQQDYQLSATYHRSTKTLSLEAFIQAYCNNDLSGIITSNVSNSTPLELHDAWNEIMFEYSSLMKTETSDYIFQISKEIGMLEHHVIYIDYVIPVLKLKYFDYLADEVRAMGYEMPFPGDENYQQLLSRITSLAKTKVFELTNLRDEYSRLNNTVTGKKQTEDEFIRTVVMLSKYQGYNIDTVATVVYRFVMIFNNYLSEMQAQEKILADGRRSH